VRRGGRDPTALLACGVAVGGGLLLGTGSLFKYRMRRKCRAGLSVFSIFDNPLHSKVASQHRKQKRRNEECVSEFLSSSGGAQVSSVSETRGAGLGIETCSL
jgi:hypothetical protein